jgi:hypothetical protein
LCSNPIKTLFFPFIYENITKSLKVQSYKYQNIKLDIKTNKHTERQIIHTFIRQTMVSWKSEHRECSFHSKTIFMSWLPFGSLLPKRLLVVKVPHRPHQWASSTTLKEKMITKDNPSSMIDGNFCFLGP